MHKTKEQYTVPPKMRVFSVDAEIYRIEVLFVMDCSHNEMAAYLNHRFGVEVDENTPDGGYIGTLLTFSIAPWRVVWVKRSKETPVILHELFHLVTRICQDRGIPIVAHHPNRDNGDEAAAYLLEFFYRKIIKLRRNKQRISGRG